ncbi:hypothetical protein [Nocardia wallacei]|uniref:hypothetical protein n=1 Tax=Nocardia wallacei TaxID=480035 RepID=UPI002455FD20|nr:hypothetical protein [Nocardia wallacei]
MFNLSVPWSTIEGMSAHDQINAANTEAARVAGWPELSGSTAQVAWANTIRADKMREFDAAMAAGPMPDSDRDLFRDALLRETSASEWIDGRSHPWQALSICRLSDDERAILFAKHT